MTDVTVTPANVSRVSGTVQVGTAGEAIDAGEVVYLKASDGKYWLADCDDTAATAAAVGIALNSAPAANQPISILKDGVLGISSGLTVGEIYVLSGTAGKIAPEGDHAQNDYVTLLGVGTTAAQLTLGIRAFGVQVP